jgi:hypothetical protein
MVLREEYDYPLPVQRPPPAGDKFVYIDYVNNEPFYVGMGNRFRVRNPDRNDYHVQMLNNRDRKEWSAPEFNYLRHLKERQMKLYPSAH